MAATLANPVGARRRRLRVLRTVGFYAVVAAVMLPLLFVFYYMVTTALKRPLDITAPDFRWVFTPTLANFREVFVANDFVAFTVNSTVVAVGSTLLGLVIGLPAAYVIARYNAPRLAVVILSARVTPGITFLIPWFILFSQLEMIDTYQALILTHLLQNLPLIVFLMISFFEEIPKEITESAQVDGAHVLKVFWSIVLPLSRSGIATAAILGFIFSWNHFMFSIVLSGNDTRTLPVAVFNFMSYGSINWGAITAAATIMTIPVLVMTLFVQRHIVRGLAGGAVKG
jgi:multiple sugar transport system permease protein